MEAYLPVETPTMTILLGLAGQLSRKAFYCLKFIRNKQTSRETYPVPR